MRHRPVGITPWVLRGQPVYLASDAQIAPNLHPFGSQPQLVQLALDAWNTELSSPIQSIDVPDIRMLPMTVPISRGHDRASIVWGIHVGHTGPRADRSPFKPFTGRHDMAALLTNLITIEFDPQAEWPIITRCYPGAYAPPLPWEPEAVNAPGGIKGCIAYWRVHAYVTTPATRVFRIYSDNTPPPQWWL